MIGIFTKPIETLTPDDVAELCAQRWPEGYTVEFKQSLPNRRGRNDPWVAGANHMDDYARDSILDEIVSFANGQGGTLVLGIEETSERPPRAAAPLLLPRVGELARRFEDMARACIDPPLPALRIRGIELQPDGAGVVVFRLDGSLAAPHRLTTTRRSCRRHGSSTIEMTMREIQELTLNVARALEGIDAIFSRRQHAFVDWSTEGEYGVEMAVGVRVTALPLHAMLDPGRLVGRPELFAGFQRHRITQAHVQYDCVVPIHGWDHRPIVRGVAFHHDSGDLKFRVELHQSGLVDLWLANCAKEARGYFLYQGWILGAVLDTMSLISAFREACGSPDAEYALELETGAYGAVPKSFRYMEFGREHYGSGVDVESGAEPVVTRVPVTSPDTFEDVINQIDTDISDGLGANRPIRQRIELVD